MNRVPLPHHLGWSLAVGLGIGALEVGLWSTPLLGLSAAELLTWLGVGAALSGAFAAAVGGAASAAGAAPYRPVTAAMVGLHSALWYRHAVFDNQLPISDPRVGGGLLFCGVMALATGWWLGPWLGRRRPAAALALGLLGAVGAAWRSLPASAGVSGDRPNVVLITLDTLRADRLSVYGGPNPTPALERLAREGALFEQAFSTAPTTEPSHLAILSGEPPYASGVVTLGVPLGDRPGLVPVALRERGWTTAGFVSAYPLHSKFGWDQGMDRYDDDFGAVAGLHRLALVRLWDQLTLPAGVLKESPADRALARALRFLDEPRDAPFFLWLHLFDPHAPYQAPGHAFDPPTDGAPLALPPYWPEAHRAVTSADWLVGAYDAEARYVDAAVGAVLDKLAEQGSLDRTVVAVTADHGESLTEHGYLFDHGENLLDPSLRVPLLLRYPPAVVAGLRVPCQVGNHSVAATLLGLAGAEDGRPRRGADLGPALGGEPCDDQPVIASTVAARYTATPPVDHALRWGGRKLVLHGAGGRSCYDLEADPGESAPAAEGCESLEETLRAALARGVAPLPITEDEESLEALRALGYLE